MIEYVLKIRDNIFKYQEHLSKHSDACPKPGTGAVYTSAPSPLNAVISETSQIVLSHQESMFAFEFAALDFLAPEKNQYAYIMEGFNEDWTYSGVRRVVHTPICRPANTCFGSKAPITTASGRDRDRHSPDHLTAVLANNLVSSVVLGWCGWTSAARLSTNITGHHVRKSAWAHHICGGTAHIINSPMVDEPESA